MKKKVKVATKVRGFLSSLLKENFQDIEFDFAEIRTYETNSKFKMLASKIIKSTIGDYLGIIQRIDMTEKESDVFFSYNRFLKTNSPYIIYLENPFALMHYSINRNKTFLGKRKVNKYLNDKNLKKIVCLSKACYETLSSVYDIPKHIEISQIYPLINKNEEFKIDQKIKNVKDTNIPIECLYISSNFTLKGGKDILKSFEILSKMRKKINVTIITKKENLNSEILKSISKSKNIKLLDFTLSEVQLNKMYSKSHILLNPTRQDSFSLVTLEAIKHGSAIFSTDLYAIPEMVTSNNNGFLTEPKYRFFEKNNMPNSYVWNNRSKTIYKDYTDQNIIEFLVEKLVYVESNRDILAKFISKSFEISNNSDFDGELIKDRWNKLISEI